MKTTKRAKRAVVFFASAALILAASLPLGLLAKSATSAGMSLEKTIGKVELSNQNGKSITPKSGLKLYDGYQMKTDLASYAFIGLDDKKAVKLDEASDIMIKKKGKKLNVLVNSGKIFFNVKEKLKPDETMEIRTSTMVTGIRGTSGEVTQESFSLFTGKAKLTYTDPATGKELEFYVEAGQVLQVNPDGSSAPILRELTAADLSGAAKQAIAEDKELQKLIAEQTNLDVPAIVKAAAAALEAEQKAAAEEEAKAKADAAAQGDNQNPDGKGTTTKSDKTIVGAFDNKPTTTPPAGNGTGTGDTGTGGTGTGDTTTPPTPPVDPPVTPPTPPPATVALTGPQTAASLTAAFAANAIVNWDMGSTPVELNIDQMRAAFEIPAGKTLNLTNGKVGITGTSNFTVNGTLTVANGATVDSLVSIVVNGSATNNGTINIKGTSNSITNQGTFENTATGTLTSANTSASAATINNNGKLTNAGNITGSANGSAIAQRNRATAIATITGGNITGAIGSAVEVEEGTANISGGTFTGKGPTGVALQLAGNGATANITGGTFTGIDASAAIAMSAGNLNISGSARIEGCDIGPNLTGGTTTFSGGAVEATSSNTQQCVNISDSAIVNISGSAVVNKTNSSGYAIKKAGAGKLDITGGSITSVGTTMQLDGGMTTITSGTITCEDGSGTYSAIFCNTPDTMLTYDGLRGVVKSKGTLMSAYGTKWVPTISPDAGGYYYLKVPDVPH